MNKNIMDEFYTVVRENDTVYMLGDMFGLHTFPDKIENILNSLPGKFVYIYGNHDRKIRDIISKHEKVLFAGDFLETKVRNNLTVIVSHYAMRTWNRQHFLPEQITMEETRKKNLSIQLFGHSHAGLKEYHPYQLDVGIDNAYKLTGRCKPFSLEEVLTIISARTQNKVPDLRKK